VDYARRRKARKRGGDQIQLPLTASLGLATETDLDLISLHEALEDLAEVDERQSQIVKLKYFVGLKVEEIAEILDVSDSTVKREWRLAKFWLRRRLKSSDRVSTPSEPSAS
jgi:RNA polymerase sigma factor (TIGR02999 family)